MGYGQARGSRRDFENARMARERARRLTATSFKSTKAINQERTLRRDHSETYPRPVQEFHVRPQRRPELISSKTPGQPHGGNHKPCNRKTDHANQGSWPAPRQAHLRKGGVGYRKNQTHQDKGPKQRCTHNHYLRTELQLTTLIFSVFLLVSRTAPSFPIGSRSAGATPRILISRDAARPLRPIRDCGTMVTTAPRPHRMVSFSYE